MHKMRRVSHVEDSTSSSNVSGLMFRYSSDEDSDDVAANHPATRAKVRSSSSQVYASTPLSGAKVNLAMVGAWPSPVKADPPYSLRQNLHNVMKQMKGKKIQNSPEVKQSPLRKRNITLSELMMSSDEESEESHHSLALDITNNKVNDADTVGVAVRTRSRETESVLDGNKKRRLSMLTEAKLEEIHNRRERNGARKSPKKITSDWKDDISIAKSSGQALRNLQPKLPMKTLNKKEVTFHLPNRSSSKEEEVSRTIVKRSPVRRNIYENKGRRKKTSDKNQIVVHAEVHSEDTAEDESDVTANGDGNKTNESPPSERGKETSQGNTRKAEGKNKKKLVENPTKSNKNAAPKTRRKRNPASENKPDPIQQSSSKTLQEHERVTRKQKKMSPREIPHNSVRSRRKSGTDNEDDPIQHSGSETLKDHESVTRKQKKMSPKEISQSSLRSRRKSGRGDEEGVRRSKRKRVRRLEYWRGERIEYRVGMDNCREMVGISAGNPDFGQKLHRPRAKRKHVITGLLDRNEDFRRKLIQLSNGNDVQMCECFSTFRIESETVESDMPVLTGLEAPGMSAGIMSIEPSTVMKDLVNDESNLVCFILSGTVTVKIQKSERTLKRSEIFYVPKGIHYSMSNMFQNEAVIGYTMYE